MRQLSELDATFLYLESETTPMHIGGLYVFDGASRETPLSFEAFKAYLRSRLHSARFFRQRLAWVPFGLDHPYWVDDPDFDLDRHVEHLALKGDHSLDDLKRLTSQRMENLLPRDRPLWRITFIDGLGASTGLSPNSFALLVRVHHAAIDPFTGEEVMGTLLQYTPEERQPAPEQHWRPNPLPPPSRLLLQAYTNAVQKPFRLASVVREATLQGLKNRILRRAGRLDDAARLFNAPRTFLNQNVTRRRQLLSTDVNLTRLRTVRDALGDVSLNDVVLGLCAEVLRRYLDEHDVRLDRPLVTLTPISVRSKSLRRPTGNQMSATLLNLATDEPDPARRIRLINRNACLSETYQQAIAADRLTELIPSTLLALSARLYSEFQLAQRYQPMFNLPITNVPGPQVPLYLQGAKLVRQFNSAPLFDGTALVILAVSYEGTVTLNFTLCPEVVCDGKRLSELVEPSLQAIETAARECPPEDPDWPGYQEEGDTALVDALFSQVQRFISRLSGPR